MRPIAITLLLALLHGFGTAGADTLTPYRIIGRIPVSDARWDYGAVDAEARRLYLGRIGGVLALDLRSGTVTFPLVPSDLVHGVLPLGEGLVMATNGKANTATLFQGAGGRILASIPTGAEPDAIALEPLTGLVVSANHGSHDLTLIDPVQRRAVATIPLPGSPEFLVAGREGVLYDNVEDLNAVAVVDVITRRILRTYPLTGCDAPTGLAYDGVADLLLSVCRNGVAKFLRGRDGRELATLDVGPGPDAAIFDTARRLAFVPAGGSGTLTVISVGVTEIAKLQTLKTQPGSRTAIFDPETGRIYIPAARFEPRAKQGARAAAIPGTYEILIIGTENDADRPRLSSAVQ